MKTQLTTGTILLHSMVISISFVCLRDPQHIDLINSILAFETIATEDCCRCIKSGYRIDSNDIVTDGSTVFRYIARNVYFDRLDVELLERAELLSEILCERDRDNTGDTLSMDLVIERPSAH